VCARTRAHIDERVVSDVQGPAAKSGMIKSGDLLHAVDTSSGTEWGEGERE